MDLMRIFQKIIQKEIMRGFAKRAKSPKAKEVPMGSLTASIQSFERNHPVDERPVERVPADLQTLVAESERRQERLRVDFQSAAHVAKLEATLVGSTDCVRTYFKTINEVANGKEEKTLALQYFRFLIEDHICLVRKSMRPIPPTATIGRELPAVGWTNLKGLLSSTRALLRSEASLVRSIARDTNELHLLIIPLNQIIDDHVTKLEEFLAAANASGS